MTASEVIETRNARIWLGDDGIVRCVVNPGAEDTLDAAKENIAALREVSKGKKMPLLVDMSVYKYVTQEAREYYSGDEATNSIRAIVLLVGSPVSKVLGSFFLRLKTVNFPIKLFTSEDDAIEWLKGFLE